MSELRAGFAVTTGARASEASTRRARLVAARAELPFLPRRGSLARTLGLGPDPPRAYVVRRDRDELHGPGGAIHVHAGLTKQRLADGLAHPLVRALAPDGAAARIADGTLGLAGDALHIAAALGCEVQGFERAPLVFSLAEEGLARLARGEGPVAEAARRVHPTLGACGTAFAALPVDSCDAVLLAPMYAEPDRAPPGYAAFRAAADHGPLDEATIAAALRVAPRLVIKLRPGEAPPAALAERAHAVLRGRAVEYWVLTR